MSSIALLSPCYWPEVRRGGERFTRELADGLLDRGARVTLITSHRGRPTRRVEDGLSVLRLPRPPQGPLTRRGYEAHLTHVPLSYAALSAGRWDLTHAMYPADALVAVRWRARTGRPAVLSYLGIPDAAGLGEWRWHRGLTERALSGLDRVVALSDYAAAAFADSFGYVAPVIAPGVDTRAFSPAADPSTPTRSPVPTIICAADASQPRKHVALLIRAFALVRRQLGEARLVLSAPQSLSDAPGVSWVDLDDRETLAAAYREAWVAALPAESEAFGLVLTEALACGTPVVGYADGAIPEVIDSAAVGRLFSNLDPTSLADALLAVIELSRRPETAAACRRRGEHFSSARCVAAYASLYRELGVGIGER